MRFVSIGLGMQNGGGWDAGNTAAANVRQSLLSNYQKKQSVFGGNRDVLSLSASGKQLSLVMNNRGAGDESPYTAMIGNSWQSVVGGTTNKELKWMDKHISQSGRKLDQMNALAKAAQNENLSDYDRILLQMEIGSLQHELNVSNNVLSTVKGIAGQAGVKNPEAAAESLVRSQLGHYEDTNGYKMLARALERAANGEAWDVAEIVHPIIRPNDYSDPTVLGDAIVVGEEWVVTRDESIPTVGEILKGRGRSLMDAGSAAVTAAELEINIRDLNAQREDLAILTEDAREAGQKAENLSAASVFWGKLTGFLDTLFRDAVHTTIGQTKNEEGHFVTDLREKSPVVYRLSEDPSQRGTSLQNKG